MAYASRQWSYLVGSFGAVLQAVAGWWDVYSHLMSGSVDPWWNPAHLTLYTGIAIVILAVWLGLRVKSVRSGYAINLIRFANTGGLKLAGLGSIMQIIACVWNDVLHRIFLNELMIAPARALLTLGMLTIGLGMIIGLSIEYGMIRHEILAVSLWKRYAIVFCMILIFSSIWLTAAGAFIYTAQSFQSEPLDLTMAVLLATFGALVLVSAKIVLPQFGTGIAIGLAFNLVAFFFLVAFAEIPPYVPWGIVPLILLDTLVVGLKPVVGLTRAITIASTVPALFFPLTYFPFTSYLFPWSFTAQLPLLIVFVGGSLGAMLGNRAYTSISSFVLGSTS
jgi:hypothetical protein